MRRRTRLSSTLLLAAFLAAAVAPPAAATPWSPLGALDAVARSVHSWWAVLTGDGGGGQRALGTSESGPSPDPTADELTSSLDPQSGDATEGDDSDGNQVAPHLDPNG